MRSIRFHDEARLELVHEVGYYTAVGPQLGERFDKAVQLATKRAACRTRKEYWIMENSIGRTRKARTHVTEELGKKADLAFLERMKKRKPTDPTKLISHEALKKSLGL